MKGLDYLINLKEGSVTGARTAKSELSGLDAAVEKTGKGMNVMGGIARSVGGILIAAFATSAVFDFMGASNEAYRGMLAADAQTRAAITSTGGIAGKTMDDLKAKADELENTTLFDADVTSGAQSLLLTFTKVRGAIFDEAIPAIQDMAQRMAGDGPADLKGASIQVGKALNDPIKGITALSKVGVSFTESQKKTIESMVAHNNVAGAQALILKELNTEFGGSAKAARDAAGGKQDLFVATEQLKEGVGELVSGGLEPFYSIMTSVTQGMIVAVDWFKANAETIKTVGEVVLITGGAYLLYEGYLLALQAPMAIMTAAQWAINAAMTANPVGIIVVGIGLLIAGLVVAYQKSETFRAGIDGLIEVGKLLGSVFMGVGKTIIGALTFDKDMFMSGLVEVGQLTEKILGGGIQKAFNKGFDASKAKSAADALAEGKEKSAMDNLVAKPKKTSAVLPGTGKADSTSVSSTKQTRNVNVTIGKLVESLTVATTNLQGAGSADIKRMITEILTGAVHDSELALSSD